MAREGFAALELNRRFPHPRGDGPATDSASSATAKISPPAWGWPEWQIRARQRTRDFPTRVGMARHPNREMPDHGRFPHPRGDGPRSFAAHPVHFRISPPAWGWPAHTRAISNVVSDFPTRVGMARGGIGMHCSMYGFPHPRGDGPLFTISDDNSRAISPPAWGWPAVIVWVFAPCVDFPTRVGMARVPPQSCALPL